MKKLFMFLAVAGLATFGTACSSSDDSNPSNPETLIVSSSKATPEVGETVTITVMEGKNDVSTTAEILVNGTKITGRTLKSDTAAEFKITAKKAGAIDAAAITVKFVAKGTELKQLMLTATPTTIDLNAETVFKVTLDGADVTGTATIKVNGTAVTGAKYKGTVAGVVSAVASLAGAKDSAPVTIIVKGAAEAAKGNITYNSVVTDVDNTIVRAYITADGTAYQAYRIALDPAKPTVTTMVTHWVFATYSGSDFQTTDDYTYVELYIPANEAESKVIFPGDPTAKYYVVADENGAIVEAVIDGQLAGIMSTIQGFGFNVASFVRTEGASTINYGLTLQGATATDKLTMLYNGSCDFGFLAAPAAPAARTSAKSAKQVISNSISAKNVSNNVNKSSVKDLNVKVVRVK